MNRSGKLKATNDHLIEELLNDPNYRVLENGTIETLITRTGKVSTKSVWRTAGYTDKNKGTSNYRNIGYKYCDLRAHRIVYAALVGPLSPDLVVNHIDGNGLNNHPSNLELVTQSENNTHRFRVLNHPAEKGNAKITQEIADAIRLDRAAGLTYKLLCAKYGICKSSISYIVNHKTWKSPLPDSINKAA